MNNSCIGIGLSVLGCIAMSQAGCGGRPPTDPGEAGVPGGGTGGKADGGGGTVPDAPMACAKMDIVFVVDDSGSMAEEQTNLASNFPRFITVLNDFRTSNGKPLDYRVAVTTTGRDVKYKVGIPGLELPLNEKGDNGAFRMKCGMSRRWLQRDDPGDLGGTFGCVAKVGTGGPSLEMPLYAMHLAFNDRVADMTNAGFLRRDALLATVVLTDEDDCSREDNNFSILSDACGNSAQVEPVTKYIDMLDKVKEGRGRWATAVIAGQQTCKSQFGDAAEAKRLKDFVSKTGKNGVFSSICAGDLTEALKDALKTFTAACEGFTPPPG